MDSHRHEVIVVGGGQAGLALGYHLSRQERDFLILEAADEPAAAWRSRWDSLRLFTPVRYDSLPGRPFPGDPDSYPTRDEVVAYLSDYATAFELPVEYGSRVARVAPADGGYLVELDDGTSYQAGQVVIATGPFQVPRIPAIASGLAPDVVQLHSADYRSPGALPDEPVLVVGGGNTGYQIAEELAATREVHMAIGSRQAPLPQKIFGRDLFRFLVSSRLIRVTAASRLGRRLSGSETLVGYSPRRARRHGIELHERAVEASGSTVRFADDTSIEVRTVVWATGFELDHSFVDAAAFGADRRLVHRRGVTDSPGLYFLGLPWQHTRGSALLGFVDDDARFIAERVAELRPAAPPEPTTPTIARSAA